MGGSVGKAINPTNIGRGLLAAGSLGTSELLQKKPFGLINNPTGLGKLDGLALAGGTNDPYIAGPFSLDPNQVAGDQNAINQLGQQQYDITQKAIDSDTSSRTQARQQLADALTKQAQSSFQYNLPSTMEDLNARHLLNGSGLGQELARQQGQIATDIANQVGVQGTQDLDLASQQRMSALQGLQGSQTGALQRGLSLEDFVNQANVAKQVGAQFAPVQPNGKQNFGTVAQGVGALAPVAKLAMK